MFKEIRPDNVVMYAMKHYNNPQGDSEKEFLDDMKREISAIFLLFNLNK